MRNVTNLETVITIPNTKMTTSVIVENAHSVIKPILENKNRSEILDRLIRKTEIITANDGRALVRKLKKLCRKPSDVFLKCNSLCSVLYNKELPHVYSKFELDGAKFFNEFMLLSMLHDLMPEYIAEPIAIVQSGTKKDISRPQVAIGYVLEYIEGQTIDYMINQYQLTALCSSYEPIISRAIFLQTAEQLKALIKTLKRINTVGLGHGDMSPGNVIVDTHGGIKLIDPFANFQNIEALRSPLDTLIAYDKVWIEIMQRHITEFSAIDPNIHL